MRPATLLLTEYLMAPEHRSVAAGQPAKRLVSVTRRSRKLMLKRLQEIDRMTAREVELIMADAERLKKAFSLKK
jgi:hypothetical protein